MWLNCLIKWYDATIDDWIWGGKSNQLNDEVQKSRMYSFIKKELFTFLVALNSFISFAQRSCFPLVTWIPSISILKCTYSLKNSTLPSTVQSLREALSAKCTNLYFWPCSQEQWVSERKERSNNSSLFLPWYVFQLLLFFRQDMLYQSLKFTNNIWVLAELKMQPGNTVVQVWSLKIIVLFYIAMAILIDNFKSQSPF